MSCEPLQPSQVLVPWDNILDKPDITSSIHADEWQITESFSGATASRLDLQGWTEAVSGANAIVNYHQENAGRYGVISLETGTTSVGRAALHRQGDAAATGPGLFGSAGEYWQSWHINIQDLSVVAQRYNLVIGFGDNETATAFTDGVYFRYLDSISANWLICASSNSSATETDSGIAVATGWHTLTLRGNDSRIDYWIDKTLVGSSVSTNIPSSAGRVFGVTAKIIKQLGITNRKLLIDTYRQGGVLA
jgi:hypothetical protein